MGSHRVKFLKSAEKEFFSLPETIQEDVLKKIKLLQEFPQMGVAMDRAYAGYRCVLAGKKQYRIVYRILNSKNLEISYIRHCRRQMGLRILSS